MDYFYESIENQNDILILHDNREIAQHDNRETAR